MSRCNDRTRGRPDPESGRRCVLKAIGRERSFYEMGALTGASLSVRAGTVTGLIGPDGAGKTLMFNCRSGVIPPEKGVVTFVGCRDDRRPDAISRAGLARPLQIARGFPRLTALASLGCESVLNLPVISDEVVIGPVNLLHEANWYTPGHAQRCRAYADLLVSSHLA